MKLIKFLRKNFSLFVNSMDWKKILLGVLVDSIALALFVGLIFGMIVPLKNDLANIQNKTPMPTSEDEMPDITPEFANEMNAFYTKAFFLFILFVVISMSLLSISRLLIWRRIAKSKKPAENRMQKIKKYAKYVFFSIVSFSILCLAPLIKFLMTPELVNMVAMDPSKVKLLSILIMVYLFVLIHYSIIFNYIYAKTSIWYKSFKDALKISTIYMNYFLIPYLMLVILSLIFVPINIILKGFVYGAPFLIIYAVLLIIFFSISRVFISKLIAIVYRKYCHDNGIKLDK